MKSTDYGTANQPFAIWLSIISPRGASHLSVINVKLQHRVMHVYEYIRKLNGKFRKRDIGKLWEYDRLVYVTSSSPVYKRSVITVHFVLYPLKA